MNDRYGAGGRFFHWLVVLLFLAQVPAGIAMIVPAVIGDFPVLPGVGQGAIDALYIVHKGLGAVLIVVVFARLFWRLTHAAPPWPDTMPALEQRIATRTHWLMYACMVVVAVSGYVHVVGLGFPVELLDALGVPPLIPRVERIAVIASFTHRFTVFLLMGLVAIHIAEVFRHHWVLGDDILGRMWPPLGRTNPYSRAAESSEARDAPAGKASRRP